MWYCGSGLYSYFLGEFISDFVTYSDEILIIGGFNIHLNMGSDPLSKAFVELTDTFGFTLFEPTHCSGTLDPILSRGIVIPDLTDSPITAIISDQYPLKFEAILVCPHNVGADVLTTLLQP